MKKALALLLTAVLAISGARAQGSKIDSLKALLSAANTDTARRDLASKLLDEYLFSYPDSAIEYAQQLLQLARKNPNPDQLWDAYYNLGWCYMLIGNYPEAMQSLYAALRWAEKSPNKIRMATTYDMISNIYVDVGDFPRSLEYERKAFAIISQTVANVLHDLSEMDSHNKDEIINRIKDTASHLPPLLHGLTTAFLYNNQLDSAAIVLEWGDQIFMKILGEKWAPFEFLRGNLYVKKEMLDSAGMAYHSALRLSLGTNYLKDVMDDYLGLAELFRKENKRDSAIFYANRVLGISQKTSYSIARLKALSLLSDVYKSEHRVDSVAKYLEMTIVTKDSLFSTQKIMGIQNMTFEEDLRVSELEQQRLKYRNNLRTWLLSGGFLVVLILAGVLYRNNQLKQKAKTRIEQAYAELKSTQSQLIQSEKMASLGELTAGIAHEIQNPLNFVNNFAEVNRELIDEVFDAIKEGNTNEAVALLITIKENEDKISHHGKRADRIVKGMLQHSRETKGQKEPTDINTLAGEYLRLSYMGLRARDKTFHAELPTHFDTTISTIQIVPQDIGRVLLNLYNNAFYAVSEKKKQQLPGYEPTVSVSTGKVDGKVEIRVRDNGNGVPEKVREKIFQPFFTTKPTGQGTGLGLSLSYDIIKAHGGELKVNTIEGEFTEFIILLPVSATV